MGMKRVSLLVGTVVAALALPACVTGPLRSPNPLGHSSTHHDPATQDQLPLRSSPTKEEVDREFDEQYPGFFNWFMVYGKDRWFDLLDIAGWDISAGRGFGARLTATEYVQAGLNWWDGTHWGMRGRSMGVWEESSVDRGIGPWYWVEMERRPTWGTQTLFDHEYKFTGWDILEEAGPEGHQDWSEFGAKAHLFAVGARARVSPIEAVDFAAGLFPVHLLMNVFGFNHPNFDIMKDDTYARIEKNLREEKGLGQ